MSERDQTIAMQGEISAFFYRQDDLSDPVQFVGLFGESIIDGLTKPLGDLNPVYVKNPAVANQFLIARINRGAPELGEFTFLEYIKRTTRSVLERIAKLDCPVVFAIKLDNCNRPDDPDVYESIFVVPDLRMSALEMGSMQTRDANEPLEYTGTMSHTDAWDRFFGLRFQEEAEALILAEVLDVAYTDEVSCGNCAPFNGGCDVLFALTSANSGSPGLSSQIVVTRDGGVNYNKYDIASLGGKSGSAMSIAGSKMVVVSEADGAHHVAPIADVSAGQWSKVSTGYQVGGSPRCIIALQPSRVFIGGAGGYVYKSTDVDAGVEVVHDATLTTENANAIHGNGQVIMTAHDNNVILISSNDGETWSAITGPSVGQNLTAIWVNNANQFWVGDNAGQLWWTMDGGTTFTQKLLPDQSNLTAILDIKFGDFYNQWGAISVQKTATSEVYVTPYGGRKFYRTTPQIIQLGTLPERINKIALCGSDHIAAAAKAAGSTDGVLAVAL